MMKNTHNGFTLIESLVAITLLMTAIAVPITIAYQGIAATHLSRDTMAAQYLAQDAADYIVAKKLSNDIASLQGVPGVTWLSGFNNSCITVNATQNPPASSLTKCYIDTTLGLSNTVGTTCGTTCPVLKYNSSNGRYSHGTGSDSKFRRSVTIQRFGSDSNEIRVVVTIEWASSLGAKSHELKFNLLNQR
jgi:prepilin-type N-terminal cleavage/methylation domain-containing protein